MSDDERARQLWAVAAVSDSLIQVGDTMQAMYHILDQLAILPGPATRYDSTVMGVLTLRVAFIDYFVEPTFELSALYYQQAYQYLPYLADTLEIDALRYTALALVRRGDPALALPYLYKSMHLALLLGDSVRMAQADTCLSYLQPQALQAARTEGYGLLLVMTLMLVVFGATLLGVTWAVSTYLRPAPGAPGSATRAPFEGPL